MHPNIKISLHSILMYSVDRECIEFYFLKAEVIDVVRNYKKKLKFSLLFFFFWVGVLFCFLRKNNRINISVQVQTLLTC